MLGLGVNAKKNRHGPRHHGIQGPVDKTDN